MQHAIYRTSPKGSKFVGTCANCGRKGLTFRDMIVDECENPRGMTQEQTILEAIRPTPVPERPFRPEV